MEKTLKNSARNENPKPEMQYSVCLPYVPGIEVLKRKLNKYNIQTYFSYKNKLQTLCTNIIKPQSNSNVYQIDCDCGAVYNGETKVGIKNRMSQHEQKIKSDDEKSDSEMVRHFHAMRFQCMFDTRKSFIIDNEIDWKRRKIKEAIYSIANKSINRHDEIDKQWIPILLQSTPRIRETIYKKQRAQRRQDGDNW